MNSRTDVIGLKKRILIPLALVFATLIGVVHYSMYQHTKMALAKEFRESWQSANTYFQDSLQRRANKLGTGLEIISRDGAMQAALRAKNRKALLERFEPLYQKLRAQYGITHLYFEDSDRVNVLRVHQPEHFGDTIDRYTTLAAEKTGKTATGIELGPNGTFTLRAVMPVFDRHGLVGYVELGEEIEDILHTADNVTGTTHVVTIGKKWLTREGWEKGLRILHRDGNWEQLPDEIVIHQTIDLPNTTLSALAQMPPNELVSGIAIEGKTYYAGVSSLEDAAGQTVGARITFHDMTQPLHEMRQTIFFIGIVSSSLAGMLLIMFYLITSLTERQLLQSRQGLIAQGMKLQQLNETLEQRVKDEASKNREKDLLLIQQSRMAAMGTMIQNIAHQWRQPLNLVGLVAQNIRSDFEDRLLTADKLEKYTATIMQSIQKMSATIDDFRDFLKPNQQNKPFSLAENVREVLSLLDASFKYHQINVTLEVDRDISVTGSPHEFSQVLLNILNNAKETILDRKVHDGTIAISVGGDRDASWIVVRDNAGGIPEEALPMIFDPYFTTKAQGTGIGLYMSQMIMERMGGTIEARNVGNGAEFRLNIPQSSQ